MCVCIVVVVVVYLTKLLRLLLLLSLGHGIYNILYVFLLVEGNKERAGYFCKFSVFC